MHTLTSARPMAISIRQSERPILQPEPGCPWADRAVLNPAVVRDPGGEGFHMLFRATGPWPQMRRPGRPLPYPIFLGYAFSRDGVAWEADFSRPALAPALEEEQEKLMIGGAINHANGCIEDPRLFTVEGTLYLSAACRLFAPGPFWENDEPLQCAPDWARTPGHRFGRAASENVTVTVLYRVDLERLAAREYERAFEYLGPITNPEVGENRDAFFFPRRLMIRGRHQLACLHRPFQSELMPGASTGMKPSIWCAFASSLDGFADAGCEQRLIAEPRFDWESNRIGASWPPLDLGNDEWLLAYHGKKDTETGYTQSFAILRPDAEGYPAIVHRCPDRLMYAKHAWELEGLLKAPCVFTTAGLVVGDELLMYYGAADTRVGMARVGFDELVDHVRRFDAAGRTAA